MKHLVLQLVQHANDVTIQLVQQDGKTVVQIRVNPDDMRRVIGKEGRVIKALRSVVSHCEPLGEKEIDLQAHTV